MYFIKYNPLKDKLRTRSLPEREALQYLVSFAGLTTLFGVLPMFGVYNAWDGVSAFLSVATAVGGILYAYSQNAGANGYDLIQKYVVLGWVVSVRVFLVAVPVLFVISGLGVAFGLTSFEASGPLDVFVLFILEVVWCQRIGRHIRDTTGLAAERGRP